jgi:hypothetical protein
VQPARDLTNFDEATKAYAVDPGVFELQAYAVDPGVFELQLGASSADIRARKTLSVN